MERIGHPIKWMIVAIPLFFVVETLALKPYLNFFNDSGRRMFFIFSMNAISFKVGDELKC